MKKLSEIKTFNEPTDWEAPEGGWGWIAALGLSLLFIVTVAPDGCFGLIFDDFIEEHQAGTTFVTAVVSVCLCSGSALGLITNFALSKFSCRQVGVTGSIVYFCGSFFSAFATSTYHLLFTYGVLQGIGLGLMVPAVFTSFNHYFIRKRTFVMGITQLIIAIVSIVVPLIIQNLLIHYGYRGTQLIISAFSLNALLSMVVQQPVKKHMRRRKVDLGTKAAAAELLSPKAIPITEGTEKVWYFDANNGGVVEVQEVSKEEGGLNKCWGAVVNFLDLRLLLDPVYVNIAVGVAVSSVTLIHFFAFHPILILSLGFSKDETALCIAIGNATDLAGRLCVALIGYGFPDVSSRLLYLLGVATTVVGRIIFVSFSEFIAVAIMTGFLGFFRSFVNVPLPLVFAEYNLDRFPSAFGLYSVMFGITAVMVGPLIGWIRDATNSYPNCVFALDALALFACVIPWTVELIIKRFFSAENKS